MAALKNTTWRVVMVETKGRALNRALWPLRTLVRSNRQGAKRPIEGFFYVQTISRNSYA